MVGRDVEAHVRRSRLTRRQWIWMIRGIFFVFACVVAMALWLAIEADKWLSVGLLSGLLISVPCIARVVEYGAKL